MAHSKNLDEILISFLLKETNAEQDKFVHNWLSKNETNKLYYEQLVKTAGLVAAVGNDNIDVEHEWNIFQKARSSKVNTYVQQQIDTQANGELPEAERLNKSNLLRIILSGAVAACLLIAVGLSYKYFLNAKPVNSGLATVDKVNPENKKVIDRREINNSGVERKILLDDGSLITLASGSEIRFSDPFDATKRNVFLKGKANFKVAKDKARPFTVFSGDIITTALGTEFSVSAFQKSENILVRLFEGKVVITSSKTARLRLKESIYLHPGEELIYNNRNAIAKVTFFRKNKKIIVSSDKKINELVAVDNPNIPLYDLGSWYMFNNQSLSQVFDQLKSLYNVEIVYNKKDLQKIYFIGKFSKTDSIQNVLKQISAINGLVSTKKNNKFYISKPQ